MRTYPRNSPQAAARIVTLAMLADGDVSEVEFDSLQRSCVHKQLGLHVDDWDAVVRDFRDDLLEATQLAWPDVCQVDPRTLDELMAEIDDPALRLKVLRLCVAVVEADGCVDDGEAIMVGTAVEQWACIGKCCSRAWNLSVDRLPTNQVCDMSDYSFLIALMAAVLLLGAWREYASDNRRDARLLGALGTGGMLAGAVIWLG